MLVHYDSNSPLRLACDASADRIGIVISLIMPDESEKPIAFAPRTLNTIIQVGKGNPINNLWCTEIPPALVW